MDARITKYLYAGHAAGERNNALYCAARTAHDEGMPEAEAMVVLGKRAAADGLGDYEIKTTVRSAYRAQSNPIFVSTKRGALTWDSPICNVRLSEYEIGEEEEVPPPSKNWESADLPSYLKSLFHTEEIVPYTIDSFQNSEGRWTPQGRGIYQRTVGSILNDPQKNACEKLYIKTNSGAGAWIRINPFDGEGVANSNVVEFRHVLVESDSLPVEKQLAIIHTSRIPCAAIVHSGGKSIHAIVKIDAGNDYAKYRRRVESLYKFLESNGFILDKQNKNPSRLSRVPGVWRGDFPQYLISADTGFPSWDEWEDWVSSKVDGLPPIEDLKSLVDNPPPLDPEIIHGILRQGHKLLLAGPSKAGKSFALIWLALALSSGGKWFGYKTSQTNVLYINLEIARPSMVDRFLMVAKAKDLSIQAGRVQTWPLRGQVISLDELAPKLIQRIKGSGIGAVIFDPVYKILVGDENSNTDMGRFCNLLDSVANDCGVSVIFSSHFSKGKQGDKAAIDRVSGAGVLGRDPDAIITLSELPKQSTDNENAYRLEFILREFPSPEDTTWIFQHPIFVAAPQHAGVEVEGHTPKQTKPSGPVGLIEILQFHDGEKTAEQIAAMRKISVATLFDQMRGIAHIENGKVKLDDICGS